jgi:hypothetical protein
MTSPSLPAVQNRGWWGRIMAARLLSKTVDGLIWCFIWLLHNWPNVIGVAVGVFLLYILVGVILLPIHIFFGKVLCPYSNSPIGCGLSMISSILQYAATTFAEVARRW